MDYIALLNGDFFNNIMTKLKISKNISLETFLRNILKTSLDKIISYIDKDLTIEINRTNLLNYISQDTHFFNCFKKCAFYVITQHDANTIKEYWNMIFLLIINYDNYLLNNIFPYYKIKDILKYYKNTSNEYIYITSILKNKSYNLLKDINLDNDMKQLQIIKNNNDVINNIVYNNLDYLNYLEQSKINNTVNLRNEQLNTTFNKYDKIIKSFIYATINTYSYNLKKNINYNKWKDILISLNSQLNNKYISDIKNINNDKLYFHEISYYTNNMKKKYDEKIVLKQIVINIVKSICLLFNFTYKQYKIIDKNDKTNLLFLLTKDNEKFELIIKFKTIINNELSKLDNNGFQQKNTYNLLNIINNCEIKSIIDMNLISIITCYSTDIINFEDLHKLIKEFGNSIYYFLNKQEYCMKSDNINTCIFTEIFDFVVVDKLITSKYLSSNIKKYDGVNLGIYNKFNCLNALYYIFIMSDNIFNKNIINILKNEIDIDNDNDNDKFNILIKYIKNHYSEFYTNIFITNEKYNIKLFNSTFYPIVLNFFNEINPLELIKINLYSIEIFIKYKNNIKVIIQNINNLQQLVEIDTNNELIKYINVDYSIVYNTNVIEVNKEIEKYYNTEFLIDELVVKEDF